MTHEKFELEFEAQLEFFAQNEQSNSKVCNGQNSFGFEVSVYRS